MLEDASRSSRVKQREELTRNNQGIKLNNEKEKFIRSLTITHVQGPLLLLFLGLAIGLVIFVAEISIIIKFSARTSTNMLTNSFENT